MKKLPIRPYVSAALLAVFLGAIVSAPSLMRAQEQTQTPRKIVSRVAPAYPELARKMRITGTVKVEVVVAPTGKLKLTQVIGGNPLLVKAAVDAIEQWRWGPAPLETKELIELNFHP